MSLPLSLVWLNGSLLSATEARIDPSDRGFLLGDGLFETLLAVDGRLPLVDRHLARLSASAAALGIPLPWSREAIVRACGDLLRAEGLAGDPASKGGPPARASLRITLTAGPGPRGLLRPAQPQPTLLISAAPQDPAPLPPARLILASTRIAAASPLRRHKTLGYMESLLARREADAADADEALICNTEGRIAEASAANIFLLREDVLWTPAIEEGALPGITRGLVLELAGQVGLEKREGRIELAALAEAEAVFLTSSLAGLRPVARLEGGDGEAARHWTGWPAPLQSLVEAYSRSLRI